MFTIIIFLFLPGMVTNASAAEILKEGSCGNNVTYKVYADGNLSISGSGEMYNYTSYLRSSYRSQITSATINAPVIDIDSLAYANVTSVHIGYNTTDVTGCSNTIIEVLGDSIVDVGSSTFYGCIGLESVAVGEASRLKEIDASTFEGCTSLKNIPRGPELQAYWITCI